MIRNLLSHFAAPNPKTLGALVTAALGMALAYGRITEAQFQAGGVFAMALLACLIPRREDGATVPPPVEGEAKP